MRTLTFNRILGVGAMGTVYHAELRLPRGVTRPCAVKVMKTTNPDQEHFRARMRDEARLLGMLQDAQILGASELVRVDGHDCVVMEYVEGVDLGDLIRAHHVPPKALAQLGAQLASTMHRAHSAVHPTTGEPLRVIHRDVKPANVMVTVRGVVRLLDFGVARAAFASRESQTQGLVLGTLNYFPPEILAGAEPTPAVDLYGLGLTLWECASGRDWGTPQVHRHRFERRVEQRMAEMGPDYEAVAAVLKKLLSWRPEDRPTGHQVERMLLAAAEGSSGPSLRSWAREAVPPVLSQRQAETHWADLTSGNQPGRELIGRTLPIEGGTPRGLEQIDEQLLRQATRSVTETFNDLAPPSAVVRSQDRGNRPDAAMDLVTERVIDPTRPVPPPQVPVPEPPPAPLPLLPPSPPPGAAAGAATAAAGTAGTDPVIRPVKVRARTTGSHPRTLSPAPSVVRDPAVAAGPPVNQGTPNTARDRVNGTPSAPSTTHDETAARIARVRPASARTSGTARGPSQDTPGAASPGSAGPLPVGSRPSTERVIEARASGSTQGSPGRSPRSPVPSAQGTRTPAPAPPRDIGRLARDTGRMARDTGRYPARREPPPVSLDPNTWPPFVRTALLLVGAAVFGGVVGVSMLTVAVGLAWLLFG